MIAPTVANRSAMPSSHPSSVPPMPSSARGITVTAASVASKSTVTSAAIQKDVSMRSRNERSSSRP
jgi:hypothetical protein